jgi:hypothetical protein
MNCSHFVEPGSPHNIYADYPCLNVILQGFCDQYQTLLHSYSSLPFMSMSSLTFRRRPLNDNSWVSGTETQLLSLSVRKKNYIYTIILLHYYTIILLSLSVRKKIISCERQDNVSADIQPVPTYSSQG